jgi:hypothetical protein
VCRCFGVASERFVMCLLLLSFWRIVINSTLWTSLKKSFKEQGRIEVKLFSPTHKQAEGRAPVWGSEFTSKRRRTTGGIQQKPL